MNKTKTLRLDHLTDPGHGWVSVPLETVVSLFEAAHGRTPQDVEVFQLFTRCSYVSGNGLRLYLEEDCDAGRLMNLAASAGYEVKFRTRYADTECACRRYAGWTTHNCIVGMTNLRAIRARRATQ